MSLHVISEQLLTSLLKELCVSVAAIAANGAVRDGLLRAVVTLGRDKGRTGLIATGAVDLRMRGIVESAGERCGAGRKYAGHDR